MVAGRRPTVHDIEAAGIGYRAQQTVRDTEQTAARQPAMAKVLGTTSRGLFVGAGSRRVIFVSYERYRSPLTVNVEAPAPALHDVATGDAVLVEGQSLTFPAADARIHLRGDAWRPPPPAADLRPYAARVEELKQMAKIIVAAGREREMGLLLRPLLLLPGEGPLPARYGPVLDDVLALQEKLRDGEGAAAAAGRLLGRGRGLTASGDDFLIGLLLFASRHPGAAGHTLPLKAFGRAVVDAAYGKTTTISANLIECAAEGSADERVVAVADAIATGSPPGREWLPRLLGWGASSGVDALAGMACAATL